MLHHAYTTGLMRSMKRIMEQQNDIRSPILTTGLQLTAQQSYTGVSLSSLLKEAGVPQGVVLLLLRFQGGLWLCAVGRV